MMLPDIVRRLDAQLPRQGGAPPALPVADIELVWERRNRGQGGGFWRYLLTAVIAGAAGAGSVWLYTNF
jgi:ubiquinone biosynthesis protein